MNKRCICEICTCGRHRCPRHPNVKLGLGMKPCMLSEYNTTYRQHPIVPRESFKPAHVPVHGDTPLEDKTTHRIDYIEHPVERPQFHAPDEYKQPPGEHNMMTSYTRDYPGKQGSPAKSVKQVGMRQVPGRFEGEPTYKSDYKKWAVSGRPNNLSNVNTWNPPSQPFEGESTFTHDYRRYNQRPRSSIRPDQAAKLSDAPFDSNTGYNDEYVKHPMPPRFVKEKESYKPTGVRFDGLSTFRRDYQGQYAPKVDSCKPDAKAIMSDTPFEDMTTFKNDYCKWPTNRPHFRDPEQYKKPDGAMDMNTTHNLAYKQHPLQKQFGKRPASATGLRPGTFDDTTNYANDYRRWDVGQRALPMMKPDYQPNTAPFEGLSTQKAHYIPHQLLPNQSFKPANEVMQTGPFDDHTMYRMDYTPKAMDPCPAIMIESSGKYKFVEVDTRGHKQYRPISRLNGGKYVSEVKVQELCA